MGGISAGKDHRQRSVGSAIHCCAPEVASDCRVTCRDRPPPYVAVGTCNVAEPTRGRTSAGVDPLAACSPGT
jgi:hypothetical protein